MKKFEEKEMKRLGIRRDVPLAPRTSWKVGGPARFFAEAENEARLKALQVWARKRGISLFVLGRGTNLLVRDGGIPGLTVKLTGEFAAVAVRGVRVRAGAAAGLMDVVRRASDRGLTGIEFLSGIPGSLGGAVIMNAGAWGHEIGERVASVRIVGRQGTVRTLFRRSLRFRYRGSNLRDAIVLRADLELERDRTASPAVIRRILAERSRRHPLDLPSAGSVFRNPSGGSAGRLIEAAGLKGTRVGGAEVSKKHANFILNRGKASAADILKLMGRVQRAVRNKHGIRLRPEIKIVGKNA